MTSPATPESPAAEPRGRLSIRLPGPLWIILASVAVVVTAFGVHVGGPIYRRHAAIREIDRLDGLILTVERGPKWLRQWLGSDHLRAFEPAVQIILSDTALTDADLASLQWFPELKSLSVNQTPVTDTGLAYVRNLPLLDTLDLSETQISDAGLVHMKGLRQLDQLFIDGTRISDSGLVHLKVLPRLKRLWANETQISDAGLTHFKEFPSLIQVQINDTRVTAEGIKNLRRELPKLYVN